MHGALIRRKHTAPAARDVRVMSYMWEDILMLGSDLSEGNARAARSQYVYHFFPTSQTLSGHTSITIGLQTKNSAAIKMGHRAPAQIR